MAYQVTEQTAKYREAGLKEAQAYLKYITHPQLAEFLWKAWLAAPAYFWEIPASSTGKYHPSWATEPAGLLRHTICAMYIGRELSGTFGLPEIERDVAVTALGIHDTLKYGVDYDLRYHDMHPYLPRSYYKKPHDLHCIIGGDLYEAVMDAVEVHMGDMASGKWASVGKLKPSNRVETVVHIADYIASRKKIMFSDFMEE